MRGPPAGGCARYPRKPASRSAAACASLISPPMIAAAGSTCFAKAID